MVFINFKNVNFPLDCYEHLLLPKGKYGSIECVVSNRDRFIPPSGANAFIVLENIILLCYVEGASLVKHLQTDEKL